MPGYRQHLFGASITYLVLVLLLSLYSYSLMHHGVWILCALAGGLFPDIDTKSVGQRFFYTGLFFLLLYLLVTKRWQTLSIVSISAMIPLCVNHRGMLHNVWFILLCVLGFAVWLLYAFPNYRDITFFGACFFFMGCMSHVYLDLGARRMFRWRI